jgi:hypothetical protein
MDSEGLSMGHSIKNMNMQSSSSAIAGYKPLLTFSTFMGVFLLISSFVDQCFFGRMEYIHTLTW